MRKLIDLRHWLMLFWNDPLPFVAVGLIGAAFSFTYSYVPLHSAKNWDLDYFEMRLDAQDQKVEKLEQALSKARSEADNSAEIERINALGSELDRTNTKLAEAQDENRRAKRTISQLKRSRDGFKQESDALLAEIEELKAEPSAPVFERFGEAAPPASADPAQPEPPAAADEPQIN